MVTPQEIAQWTACAVSERCTSGTVGRAVLADVVFQIGVEKRQAGSITLVILSEEIARATHQAESWGSAVHTSKLTLLAEFA